jgi:uncharacterized membrane protein SirB2
MLKSLHFLFIVLSFGSFIGRVALAEFKPDLLEHQLSKIGPHIINALLILSGVILVFDGNWLAGQYGWIIGKIIVLLVYVALGVVCMHSQGQKRWLTFAGAVACFVTIFIIAIAKPGVA